MATSLNLGYPLWCDGQEWTSLLSRQFAGGAAVWDSNASATAVNPLGGVFGGAGNPLQVTQQVSANMSVLVNAGYVAVPHPTAQHGVYLFGLLDQATLTIASNGSASIRYDLIIARVYDEDSSGSFCDVEVIEGTPGNGQPATPSAALLLAVVEVPVSATSIVTGDITDERTFTVAPGGLLPSTTAAAPTLGLGQVLLNTSEGLLERLASPVTYTQTWTVGGTYSWIAPDGAESAAGTATASGSGGGGMAAGAGGASGGGAGEWAGEPAIAITPGHTYTVIVGTGGTGGDTTGGAGNPGSLSSFQGDALLLRANPGTAANHGTGGVGGTGSTNSEHNDGGDGFNSSGTEGMGGTSGGGGSSGGPGAPGNQGRQPDGAAAVPGGGPGGDGAGPTWDDGPGNAPYAGPGGGGGGAQTFNSGVGYVGGQGADGQVTLSWTVQPTMLTPLFSTDSAEDDLDDINTSGGSTGLTPGSGSAFGWGIGYGNSGSFDADNGIIPQIQVTFDADGATDFQFDMKWGMAVAEAMLSGPVPHLTTGQCRIILLLDGTILDMVYLRCGSTSAGVTQPGDGGAWTYYTSGQRGTTPASGAHTATLAIETLNTHAGESGAHVGNLASTGKATSAFGSVPSYFTTALTAENCSLRVAGILASSI